MWPQWLKSFHHLKTLCIITWGLIETLCQSFLGCFPKINPHHQFSCRGEWSTAWIIVAWKEGVERATLNYLESERSLWSDLLPTPAIHTDLLSLTNDAFTPIQFIFWTYNTTEMMVWRISYLQTRIWSSITWVIVNSTPAEDKNGIYIVCVSATWF